VPRLLLHGDSGSGRLWATLGPTGRPEWAWERSMTTEAEHELSRAGFALAERGAGGLLTISPDGWDDEALGRVWEG
jgi:hypothetical protein